MDLENLQPGDRIFIQFTEKTKTRLQQNNHPKLDFEGQWLVVKSKYPKRESRKSLDTLYYKVEATPSPEGGWPADGFAWVPYNDFLIARSMDTHSMGLCMYLKGKNLPDI